MKKNLLLAIFAAAAMSASAAPTVLFDGTDAGNFKFVSGSTVTYADGVAKVEMGVQSNGKYRADIEYCGSADITFNPETDKYIGLEFVSVPQANISIEINDPELNFVNTYLKKNNFQGSNFKNAAGNTVVYCDLSTLATDKDDNQEFKTYADAGTFSTKTLKLKVADNTEEPHSYALASIMLGSSLEELGMIPTISNTTTGKGFANLKDAFAAAQEGDVLKINENISITERLIVPCTLTIEGASKDVTITRNFTGIMMLVNAPTTFSNITLTSIEGDQNNVYLEVNKVQVTFNNVDFVNIGSSKDQGIVGARQGAHFVGNDITFTNCTSTNASCPGFIFDGTNSRVTLNGSNNNVSVTFENVGQFVTAGENLSASPAIAVSFKTAPTAADAGKKVIDGTRDNKLFTLVGATDLYLQPDKDASVNALVISTEPTTGIDDAILDDTDNAPAEYFDLTGRRVETPAAGGLYIVRKGSKTYKVVL